MKQFFLYTKCRLATDKWVIAAQALMVVLLLPALYAIGMANQPELFSYVEDGLFYGTYHYDFTLARSMAGGLVVAWTWLWSMRSFSGSHHHRKGIFYAMLPVGWGVKFSYEALKSLVVVPALLCSAFLLNHMVWYSVLVEPIGFFASSVSFGLITLLVCFNALFFMIGAVVRKNAWMWCAAVLLAVAGVVYAGETYEWEALKSTFQPNNLSCGLQTVLWGSIVLFVAVAARAVRKLEVK